MDVFNLSNFDSIDAISIAKIVCDSMSLKDVEIKTSGGVDNGRGWIGDVKKMQLDISKIKKLGWSPKFPSAKAVKMVTNELVKEDRETFVGN